jgi:hypothetical protein
MAVSEHFRFKIFNKTQHILQHSMDEFVYSNSSLPNDVQNVTTALDYFAAVLFPHTKPSVATVGDLPLAGNTIQDYRIVEDDGDGKAAGYMWLKYDGDAAAEWKKVSDMDWGVDSVLSGLLDQTQYLYPRKYGTTDYDPTTELPLAGIDAGQHFFGGDLTNQNLTLHANNGDIAGRSGYIQFDDSIRPTVTGLIDIGTATEKFNDAYITRLFLGTGTCTMTSDGIKTVISDNHNIIEFDTSNLSTDGTITGETLYSKSVVIDDLTDVLTITGSTITSDKGTISFGNENLTTTGEVGATEGNFGDVAISNGSITSSSGEISFGATDIVTTGSIDAGSVVIDSLEIDQVKINNNKVFVDTLLTNLELEAPASQVIKFNSNVDCLDVMSTGDITADRFLTTKITIDANKLYSSDLIEINAPIVPLVDNTTNIGTAIRTIGSLYIKNQISDGTVSFTIAELIKLRSSAYRDATQLIAASEGDVVRWDVASSRFLSSVVTDLFGHDDISGIATGDAGHTQFAMLLGRAGGQVVNGGIVATQTLTLKSYTGATEGVVVKDAAIVPANDKLFSIGESSIRFLNMHLWGEIIGARVENKLSTDLAGMASIDKKGRLVYTTDDERLNIDIGGSYKKVGHNTYNALKTNVELALPIDVSAFVDDARNAIWQLCDSNELVLGVEISKTQTTVTISTDINLTAGNYRLLGIEL